jgi:hypothetical protein
MRLPEYSPDPVTQISMHKALCAWAKKNTRYLQIINKGTDLLPLSEFRDIHSDGLKALIVDYNGWKTLLDIKPPEPSRAEVLKTIEQKLASSGDATKSAVVRHCVAADLFVELSRTNFIVMYQSLKEESARIEEEVKRTKGLPTGDYDVLWSLDKSVYFYAPLSAPLMSFGHPEIRKTLMVLTERIDQLPFEAFDETKRLLKILYTRNSVFFCQKTDGVPETRDYMTFCCIYFHAIQRRIFYYELLDRFQCNVSGAAVREWVANSVCTMLGSEGFEDCFGKSCEEAYRFPGDADWFAYRYPALPAQTGSILGCFRPEHAKRYYTDYRLSQEAVLAAVDQDSHSGHCARLFVINAIDQYMRVHHGIPWKDGLVIQNNGLEGSHVKLFRGDAPYLVQVFSRYSVYYKGSICSKNCIYETFACWLNVLKTHYGSAVFETTMLTTLVNKLL